MGKEDTVVPEDVISDREKNQQLYGFFAAVPRTSLVRDYAGADFDVILDVIGERRALLDQNRTIPRLAKLLSPSPISHTGKRFIMSDFEACSINGVHDDVPGYSPELERKFELYRMNDGDGVFSVKLVRAIEIDLYNDCVARYNHMLDATLDSERYQRFRDAAAMREKEKFYLKAWRAVMSQEERERVEQRIKTEAYYEKVSKKVIDLGLFLPVWKYDIERTHNSKLVTIP